MTGYVGDVTGGAARGRRTESPCSVHTVLPGAQRLPWEMISALLQTGVVLSHKALEAWLWRGRAIKLADGTGVSVSDTGNMETLIARTAGGMLGGKGISD